MLFEWDVAKNHSDRREHGIGFEDASQVFYDPLHSVVPSGNEDGEARWRAIGRVSGMIVFVVIHTSRERHQQGDWVEVIRLISARRATRQEQKRYEDQDG